MTFVIIGGGGHGLATAFYLASEHGLTNIARARKRAISAAATFGRNTTIGLRANYGLPGNSEFYSHFSLKLWEGIGAGAELQT